jgi:hypothetical protein
VIDRGEGEGALGLRIAAAVGTTRARRVEAERVEGLSRMCRRLEEERRAAAGAVGGVLDGGGGDAEGVVYAGDASDLALDGELDVEALLRGSLEGLSSRMRSVNAAVFLPTGSGDYALGAYVNSDLSAQTRDALLDALADAGPGAVELTDRLMVLRDDASLVDAFGDAASWLEGRDVVAGSCVERGESIAALVFFRDRSSGFGEGEVEELRRFRASFAARLGRVVRVHNRAVPGLQWFGFDVGEAEEDEPGEEWRDAA